MTKNMKGYIYIPFLILILVAFGFVLTGGFILSKKSPFDTENTDQSILVEKNIPDTEKTLQLSVLYKATPTPTPSPPIPTSTPPTPTIGGGPTSTPTSTPTPTPTIGGGPTSTPTPTPTQPPTPTPTPGGAW